MRQGRFLMRESRLTAGIYSTTMKIEEICHKIRKEAKKQVKHRLLALLLTCCAVLLGLPAAYADTPTMTILMYMCGTDLQSDCVNDLYEMCAAEIPDNVTVVVQAGGASQWDDSRLRANRINRFTIVDYDFSDVTVCAWQNMGTQDTLEDYLNWAVSTYPADRYMLVFWNHGGGSNSGVCFDETADYDGLTIHEINDALYNFTEANPGFHLDVIGFDACLMATYEMAAHMQYYADFMVASEELEPGLGWNYAWLDALGENPALDAQGIGVAIADAYMEACLDENPDDYLSMSVLYLPAMEYLVSTMETYAAYLSQALDAGQLSTFSRARQRMYAFGDFNDATSDMVDMMALIDGTRTIAPQTADVLQTAYERVVRYNVGTRKFDYLTGMSVYFPSGSYDGDGCQETIPNMTEFTRGYAELRSGGNYVFSAQVPQQVTSGSASGAFTGNLMDAVFSPASTFTASEAPLSADTSAVDLPDIAPTFTSMNDAFFSGFLVPDDSDADDWLDADFSDEVYACSMTLSQDELNNLSMVEGLLYLDGSDDEDTFYIEMGAMQNAAIDWESGEIISQFDGTWPMLDEQIVMMYDQLVNGGMRRSVIPVRCNDVEGYLLVMRRSYDSDWTIVGFTQGYDDAGLPVRGSTPLTEGDVVTPIYNVLYEDEDGELQEMTMNGDPIVAGEGGAIDFGFYSLEGSDATYLYCFCLTDIYGEIQLSDFISFEL